MFIPFKDDPVYDYDGAYALDTGLGSSPMGWNGLIFPRTALWQSGACSNFHYLDFLNCAAGRSRQGMNSMNDCSGKVATNDAKKIYCWAWLGGWVMVLARQPAGFVSRRFQQVDPIGLLKDQVPQQKVIHLGTFNHDLTVLPNPGLSWFILEKSSPFMAQLFRSVNYYNLPRFMCIHLYMTHLFQKCGIPSQIDQIGLPEKAVDSVDPMP